MADERLRSGVSTTGDRPGVLLATRIGDAGGAVEVSAAERLPSEAVEEDSQSQRISDGAVRKG